VGAAGIHPAQTLPISLDVGTDNPELLKDELYIGHRQPRLRGEPYDQLVDEFVRAVKLRFPKALLQWEDFKQWNALRLLDRYRHELPSFNDDIQGTAAVAVAGLLAAARATGRKLTDLRVVMTGGGAAGLGIARLFRAALRSEGATSDEALRAIAVLDSHGLIVDATEEYRREVSWPAALARKEGVTRAARADLFSIVKALRPTALIGVSGVPKLFSAKVVREMARYCERPIIFPLSNPTSKSEASPHDLLTWTKGKALVATGSPFAPVKLGRKTFRIGQGNNVFIFPGVGLGAMVTEARLVSDGMFAAAARTLAAEVSDEDLAAGSFFPPVSSLRAVTAKVAQAVARAALAEGLGNGLAESAVPVAVAAAMWEPLYPALEAVPER
jgi:malic enzyme